MSLYVIGVVCTNKLVLHKFIPCEKNTSDLPYSLYSDNHGEFKVGLFKKLLRKLCIFRPSLSQNWAETANGEKRDTQRR